MSGIIVRRAGPKDLEAVAVLIQGFAKGHPAENYARSTDQMRKAFFGMRSIAQVILAETNSEIVGLGVWRRTYDLFWSLFGGEGLGLYVAPSHRGRGVALSIIAAMCSEIREDGGSFLQANYGADLAPLFERIAIGTPERSCHLSSRAFQQVADACGRSPREIIRELPGKALNYASETRSPTVG